MQRPPNILVIPGTSSLEPLRENPAASRLALPQEAVTQLDTIGQAASTAPDEIGAPVPQSRARHSPR